MTVIKFKPKQPRTDAIFFLSLSLFDDICEINHNIA